MLLDLPYRNELNQALLERDLRYSRQTYASVSNTEIFCWLTCPTRKPKCKNCTFYNKVAECIEAGFRPCNECHPLRPSASSDPLIDPLLQALEERPKYRWREGDVENMGFNLPTVRRSFERYNGVTFL